MSDAMVDSKEVTTDTAPEWYVTWVEPYVAEPVLWPVAVALSGHVMLLLAPVLLAVVRTRHPSAILLLLMLIAGTAGLIRFEVMHRGRPRGLSGAIVFTWMVSILVAIVAFRTDFI